jgi:uncharacterized SAM-binding protein YcdF (DUF218 family)
MRRWWWLLLLVPVAWIVGILAGYVVEIERQSKVDEARKADVIVVLGAAEYNGRPSPVLRARLQHALELWRAGYAPRLMTTGGAGGDPRYTEGIVGRDYLVQKGVPLEAIIVEEESETTVHTIAAVSEIMRRMSLKSAILVSDGYHIFRAKKMLQSQDMAVYGSPRANKPGVWWREYWLAIRQAFGYMVWQAGIHV